MNSHPIPHLERNGPKLRNGPKHFIRWRDGPISRDGPDYLIGHSSHHPPGNAPAVEKLIFFKETS
jgi:hypothetical protein